ncbi:ThiJ/PfpI [Trichormus variabilis ATCC 29413]|uniref:ThiJ/PfpI n=2 Tax=Anabaena variabilis TaxID=264691 RepID=Q3M506_TRIV2|nr:MULTISPECIES: DJ-1/PfpI family protein [Nostocaceae]ABA23930.1 ThiJ/PfpI [Trichormus variabilis ATCC 29413]MBC1216955.1 DJ-1/PfpI family protein [Trichormus variabilis ARAD]MBC1256668.1 DJ-1/PfpI family protein [Trichormus variabilis V5]MBC1266699.1 DJ-1/PfpI family protein [Trichormus variabilis FSR]MBC1300506.1 DJ-1/PfpI family protein [Trichormus variabilis N2B]
MTTAQPTSSLSIGIVLFPNVTQLDFTAPYEVFNRLPNTKLYLLSETLEPIRSDGGLTFLPDTTFAESPLVDLLFVPGGSGIDVKLEDKKFLAFLKTQGEQARYVTSVCTGALLLAAAGLLQGYRATTHWLYLDLLELLGVEVVKQRVVIDRNRITGGGVTAGIDFGLVIAGELFTEAIAQSIQLAIEYNPQPPFESGSPETAPEYIINSVKATSKNRLDSRRQIIQKIVAESSISISQK